jgi:hypothetical protein
MIDALKGRRAEAYGELHFGKVSTENGRDNVRRLRRRRFFDMLLKIPRDVRGDERSRFFQQLLLLATVVIRRPPVASSLAVSGRLGQ